MIIIIIFTTSITIILSFCIIYLVFSYRKLLDKYTELSIRKKVKIESDDFVNEKVEKAIDKAVSEGVDAISKNAETVAKSMRKKTIEKLLEEEKGEEKAISSEYDQTHIEIENYKAQKFEEIRKKSNEILKKLNSEVLPDLIDENKANALITKALEDAKRSNIF